MYFCYHSTCLRGVAQTWQNEILTYIGMLGGSNTAPVFTVPMKQKVLRILWFVASK